MTFPISEIFPVPLTKEKNKCFRHTLRRVTDLFLTRCAEGRNMPKDSMALYAEGRVWTGNQAKEIGLVDELGGIEKQLK